MKLTRRDILELAAISAVTSPAQSKQPNVVLLLGDDHRADALGCMGNSLVQTPNLDRLARDGILFKNHFTTTPICCASRASIMLGQYAGGHGIYDFATPLNPNQVARTYWSQMRQAGYYIGFIGKFGVGNKMPESEFDVWNGFPGQGAYFPKGQNGPHLNHIMRDQANHFLRTAPSGKPFCLSISFKAPHVQDEDPRQYLPSEDTRQRYAGVTFPPHGGASSEDVKRFPVAFHRSENRRRWAVRFGTPELHQASMNGYYRLVTGIDDVLGSIRATLDQMNLADDTIIIYSADHGIFNGEHGFAGKWYAHEESLRIPLIVLDPRIPAKERGLQSHGMTLNIDLQPTILGLTGIQPNGPAHGKSLVSQLSDEQKGARSIFYFEHRFPFNGWIPSSEGVRTSDWKYIRYTDVASPFQEMYDLKNDPAETVNLIGSSQYRHQQETLARYCERWKQELAGWKPDEPWRDPITQADLEHDLLT